MSDIKKIVLNSGYLVSLQLANFIFPFIVIPFLSKSLALETFGFVMTMIAIVQFSYILTEYGTNVFATKILIQLTDKKEKDRLNSNVLLLKLVISVILFLIVYFLYHQELNFLACMGLLGAILFQSVQPSWVFNAKEEFRKFSLIVFVGKVVYLPLVIFFCDEGNAVEVVLLSLAVGNFLTFIFSFKELKGVSFHSINYPLFRKVLKEGFSYLIARVTANAHFFLSLSLIGFLWGNSLAGVVAIADVIARATKGIFGSIIQAMLPRFIKSKNHTALIKVTSLSLMLLLLTCLILYFGYDLYSNVIFNDSSAESKTYLPMLLLIVVINFVNSCLGYPLFSIFNKEELVNYISLACFVVFLFFLVLLFNFYDSFTVFDLFTLYLYTEVLNLILRLMYIFSLKNIKES